MNKYTAVITWCEDILTIEARNEKEAELKVFDLMTKEEQERYSEISIRRSEEDE